MSSVVYNLILPALKFARNIKQNETVYCFFLFDEFSLLEPEMRNMNTKISNGAFESVRQSIYSFASNLVQPTSAVIVSGFKPRPVAKTLSGRHVVSLPLSPIDKAVARREI